VRSFEGELEKASGLGDVDHVGNGMGERRVRTDVADGVEFTKEKSIAGLDDLDRVAILDAVGNVVSGLVDADAITPDFRVCVSRVGQLVGFVKGEAGTTGGRFCEDAKDVAIPKGTLDHHGLGGAEVEFSGVVENDLGLVAGEERFVAEFIPGDVGALGVRSQPANKHG
jgi:hypothetical protein